MSGKMTKDKRDIRAGMEAGSTLSLTVRTVTGAAGARPVTAASWAGSIIQARRASEDFMMDADILALEERMTLLENRLSGLERKAGLG